jgi:hypothetical protein
MITLKDSLSKLQNGNNAMYIKSATVTLTKKSRWWLVPTALPMAVDKHCFGPASLITFYLN